MTRTSAFAVICFSLVSCFPLSGAAQTPMELRKSIGPVYAEPTVVGDQVYFLSSSGILYEADKKMEKPKKIFQTRKQTVSGIAHSGDMLYFGEGLHGDKTTTFYGFNLKRKKTTFRVFLDGHMEKTPLVIGNKVFVPAGQAGLIALDAETGELLWRKTKIKQGALHVDSTPIRVGKNVCAASIYETKAIFCVELKDGKEIWATVLDRSPKTDLIYKDDKIISLGSEGRLVKAEEREEPTEFVVINAMTGKFEGSRKTRGFNLFPQVLLDGRMFMALSTGDVLEISVSGPDLTVIDQFPEPFSSSTFTADSGKLLCAVSSLGRIVCYRDKKRVLELKESEIVIGKVGPSVDGHFYLPTRIGYKLLAETDLVKPAADKPATKPAEQASPQPK